MYQTLFFMLGILEQETEILLSWALILVEKYILNKSLQIIKYKKVYKEK